MLAPIVGRNHEMPKKATINQYKYDATHCRVFRMKLNLTIDADIIEKLTSVPSMQGYIKQLIRNDLNGTIPVPVCETVKEMLKEESERTGKDVCTLAKLIISDYLLRTQNDRK